ncbi:LOW QUALITY PROTEIN: nuclear cap-binding protein subunit 1-A-like [Ptychodera flava]|uniref:LOW QUALITY PROTEIN: nuclear cap-binding protein subunit 1-A-like n=1 Tax=Ptychodera flava TaxID=63121 RepID=UPI00396A3E1F
MSRRRPHSDDEEGGRTHKRRRTTSDHNEIEDRLESLITRVGEKSTSSLETNLEGLASVLEADLPSYKPKIAKILVFCAISLPEKISVYSTLVGLLNARNYNFGGEFVENVFRNLREFLKTGSFEKARVLVRFLTDLVNCHVIDLSSMLAMYEAFVAVTIEDEIPQVRSDWYVYAVLSSIPWIGKELHDKKEMELEKLLSNIEKYISKRKKRYMPFLKVWTSDVPNPQEEYLDCLWHQIEKLKKEKWVERTILRPYLAFDSILCEALQHTLPPINPPAHSEDMSYPLPRVIFRLFDYTDTPEGPVLPGHHSIDRFLIEETLSQIIHTHHKERKECAAQLVSYHGKNKVPLNYMIIEVMFGQMLNLPQPPYLEIFYASLLIELCKLQPSSLPQVLAQATELLYERLDTMNVASVDRFVNWFSHHLSNFQFRWSWEDWAECVTANAEAPKPKFVRETLEKCMRLSYHQRIAESVPEDFAALVPEKPSPIYKYTAEGSGSLPGTVTAHQLIASIKAKATAEEVLSILKELPNPKQEDDQMEDENSFNPLRIDVFVLTVLHMGSKSFSHSFSALAKFHSVFKALADSEESQMYMLNKVYEIWQNHHQMISVLVDKMLRTQIVDCSSVANWLFSKDMSRDFTRYYVWEMMNSTIRKMNKHVNKIAKELQEARAKLDKRDRGSDSEDSDTDMPSEEQVERLQERLETAQSEQKNLFLIIFQRFIIILTEHIVKSENEGQDFNTHWYKQVRDRLQQVFLSHHEQVEKYIGTLENLLFTNDIDQHILEVFQQFRALTM